MKYNWILSLICNRMEEWIQFLLLESFDWKSEYSFHWNLKGRKGWNLKWSWQAEKNDLENKERNKQNTYGEINPWKEYVVAKQDGMARPDKMTESEIYCASNCTEISNNIQCEETNATLRQTTSCVTCKTHKINFIHFQNTWSIS